MAGGSDAVENTLSCAKCGKPANLQCPKCVELKLPRESAAFCSQDCFKASWSSHKSVHLKAKLSSPTTETPGEQNSSMGNDGWLYCMRKGQARTAKLPQFDWTGKFSVVEVIIFVTEDLASWKVASFNLLVTDSEPRSTNDIIWMISIGREVLDAAARVIRPGITTDEIDAVVHEATIAAGIINIPHIFLILRSMDEILLNQAIVSSYKPGSVNEVICHGIPDARKLEDGDIVNVDVTVYYKGVHGDLNETFFVGNVDEASQRLVQCTYECLEKSIAAVKPGVRFREIGEIINRHATMSGLSVVKSYCGHGIGELFHCAPNIPHYAIGVMKAGQTFTIEPMINSGIWRDRMWPDGWTAVTADGKRSAQFEHTLLVTDTGVEVLTARLPSSPDVFPWLRRS
ncbi:hypothetical protein ACJIZ3_016200 [Penstemon smallii]|uniref:Methionine aminopeptidase n=1 Tax=Penstemon smallii TaxID=265156 RepID=A0ABD3RPP6_9LAMI